MPPKSCQLRAFIPAGDLRGTEHIGSEDMFDTDYGRLLERIYANLIRKRGTSPAGFEPAFWP